MGSEGTSWPWGNGRTEGTVIWRLRRLQCLQYIENLSPGNYTVSAGREPLAQEWQCAQETLDQRRASNPNVRCGMSFRICRIRVSLVATLVLLLVLAMMAPPAPAGVTSVVILISTPNPVVQGQNDTFSAGVNWTATAAPTGTITLTDTVLCPGASSATVAVLGTITLGSATSATPGAGTLVVSSFPCAAGNSIVATYSGDSNYSPGASQPLLETVVAQFTPTSATLSSSLNPSTVGQSVTFTAQLRYTLTNNTYPTGSVVFTDANTGYVLGTASVQTSGSRGEVVTAASITTSSLAAGFYAVRAAYLGNSFYAPSTSQIVNQVAVAGTGPIPTITSVVTTQGAKASQNSTIAQNTWIEIHGTNLSQSTQDWSNQDFSKGLPTAIAGVSATVSNKPAAIYYVSPTQVNILTPIDNSTGPVPVVLTTLYGSTAIVTPTMLQISPSFLVIDGAGHVAARHADYSLAGPAALSAPGYTFTPVKPGETVLLYSVGFGQTSPAITDQLGGLGSLPTLPTVTIGGIPATVQAAGISGPGLYQFNVVVPASAPAGDLTLSATYNGVNTQSGVTLTVQP
jgi:uncharacterized protein (TIGR03437 family)